MLVVEDLQDWSLWTVPLLLYLGGAIGVLAAITGIHGRCRPGSVIVVARSAIWLGIVATASVLAVYIGRPPAVVDGLYTFAAAGTTVIVVIGVLIDWLVVLVTRRVRATRQYQRAYIRELHAALARAESAENSSDGACVSAS
ncbi:hypothetical protein [Gordonia malaquae]|uniref:hypothetical protein n=1 Tax=Gordonia malaquae TaxID=410332 RepID=UPI0030161E97